MIVIGDGQLYKVARNDYNIAVDTARNEGWKALCMKAECTKSVANIVKNLDVKNMKQISLLKNKGELTTTPQQSLECMMSIHFINSTSVSDEQLNYTAHSLETESVLEYIDEHKVARAINSFGPLKAAGPDGIKPIVLQMLNLNYVQKLTSIYRGIIKTGYTPSTWREMEVAFLPKVGKSD